MTDKALAQADPEVAGTDQFGAVVGCLAPMGSCCSKMSNACSRTSWAAFSAVIWCITALVPTPRPRRPQVQRNVRLGAPLPGVEIICEEQAWPLLRARCRRGGAAARPGFLPVAPRSAARSGQQRTPWRAPADCRDQPLEQLRACAISSPRMPCARRAASHLHGSPTGSTCWALRWRNAASGAIVRRSLPKCGKAACPAGNARPVAGNWQVAASMYWLRAKWWWACALSTRCAGTDGQADSLADGQGQSAPHRLLNYVRPGSPGSGAGHC